MGFLGECRGLPGECPCGGVISIELHSNSFGITLPHGCSPVSLLCLFGAPSSGSTSRVASSHGNPGILEKPGKPGVLESQKWNLPGPVILELYILCFSIFLTALKGSFVNVVYVEDQCTLNFFFAFFELYCYKNTLHIMIFYNSEYLG